MKASDRFHCVSRRDAESFSGIWPQVPHIWISVRDMDVEDAELERNPHRLASIFLAFDDAEGDEGKSYTLISNEQAAEIVALHRTYGEQCEKIVANCMAGISRSAGIIEALSVIETGRSVDHVLDPGWVMPRKVFPNNFVKRTIIRARMEAPE